MTTRSVDIDQPMSNLSTITAEVNLAVRQRIERVASNAAGVLSTPKSLFTTWNDLL